MPLSEEELRLLEQMERALVEEDPKLASTLRGTSLRRSARRRAIVAGVCFVVGVAVLMTGAIAEHPGRRHRRLRDHAGLGHHRAHRAARPAGRAAAEPRRAGHPSPAASPSSTAAAPAASPPPAPSRSAGSFMERMEERWRRRRDENGGF